MITDYHRELLRQATQGHIRSLARLITLIENQLEGYYDILTALPVSDTGITGITGAPGAGKSTLTDAVIGEWVAQHKRVGVLCIDPSSPFNQGALLGDRIRMSRWYNHPTVYIRSLASRGSLGGLNPTILEITDLMKTAGFDEIIIETVGVGQSEVEIAGIADTTIVVLTPEGGDEIQTMKAGLLEVADLFVVNKADRPGADLFTKNLTSSLAFYQQQHENPAPVLRTVALSETGIKEVVEAIGKHRQQPGKSGFKNKLLAEKAFLLIQKQRMKNVSKTVLENDLMQTDKATFNLYRFVQRFI